MSDRQFYGTMAGVVVLCFAVIAIATIAGENARRDQCAKLFAVAKTPQDSILIYRAKPECAR